MDAAVDAVLDLYPKIYFACHRRHVSDPKNKRTLSAHQASILDHLDRIEGTSLTELAQHMGIKASAMSIATTRLVKLGYVVRQRDADDKRKLLLRLTKDGARLKGSQSVLEPERVEAMLGNLTEPERQQAVSGLAMLAKAAQQLMHEISHRPGKSPLDDAFVVRRQPKRGKL